MPDDSSAPVTKRMLDTALHTMQSDLISYIDLKHEQLLHDFRGIFGDRTDQQNGKIANHEERIQVVETALGLAA